ncbi:MAG: hypothetical protein R6U50_10590 [Desulfobacterales bacterium]
MIQIVSDNLRFIALYVVLLCGLAAEAAAQEGKIITIKTAAAEANAIVQLEPVELTISKNSVVIWLNAIKDQDVNISLSAEERPDAAFSDAMGFSLEDGMYTAKYLPFIATASLRFVKEGVYTYRVELSNGKKKAHGTIKVCESSKE